MGRPAPIFTNGVEAARCRQDRVGQDAHRMAIAPGQHCGQRSGQCKLASPCALRSDHLHTYGCPVAPVVPTLPPLPGKVL